MRSRFPVLLARVRAVQQATVVPDTMAPKNSQKKAHYSSHLQVGRAAVQQQQLAGVWLLTAQLPGAAGSYLPQHGK
jgi:hypothetical protein